MVRFKAENLGIDQQRMTPYNGAAGSNGGMVQTGSLDWQTHIMNKSTGGLKGEFQKLYKAADAAAHTMYEPAKGEGKLKRELSKLSLYCSKVSIPPSTKGISSLGTTNSPSEINISTISS